MTDQLLVVVLGIIAWGFAYITLKVIISWIQQKRSAEKFVVHFRQSPMLTFIVAIPYFLIFMSILFPLLRELLH